MALSITPLSGIGLDERGTAGGKAAVLGALIARGFPVPPGFVLNGTLESRGGDTDGLVDAARSLGGDRFAVRSSGTAEDLADASFAGQYETYLDVPTEGLADAVVACLASARSTRADSYRQTRAIDAGEMAVLIQPMIDASVAGVAFSVDPVRGDDRVVITAAPSLGEAVVSGEAAGEEWAVDGSTAIRRRRALDRGRVLSRRQAKRIAAHVEQIAVDLGGPQDVEWAIDRSGKTWILQARPMTAIPRSARWDPPGPGLWMRNFRLGEWLPEAVTPLFATWLLPALEAGFQSGMRATVGTIVPFRYALVNGWYYLATPSPSIGLLPGVLRESKGKALPILLNALIRVSTNPPRADRDLLDRLNHEWNEIALPDYRRTVEVATAAVNAPAAELRQHVDRIAEQAGIAFWYLAVVGGSAWKMEARLQRFCRRHLNKALPAGQMAQLLLRGLAGTEPQYSSHAVQSADWYFPTAGELPSPPAADDQGTRRLHQLAEERTDAEAACRRVLARRPRLLKQFDALVHVARKYAVIRETQARDFTLGWPTMRACLGRLAGQLDLGNRDDIYFCTRDEILRSIEAGHGEMVSPVPARRQVWDQQRHLSAPLTLGRAPRVIGDVVARAAETARTPSAFARGSIIGHPASVGRATGPVRVVHDQSDFARFQPGDVLVAKWTAPAWTPLFARAAAVVTDGGSLAAHASIVAREYGIPAVVGTGDATSRLHDGQLVTVDGGAGVVQFADPT